MARLNSEADSDFNWLQFVANHEMHNLLPDNLFANALMEDNSFTALLGLPSTSVQNMTRIVGGGPESFPTAEDVNVNLAADLQQCFAAGLNVPRQPKHFAMTTGSNVNLAGIDAATTVLPALPSDPSFVERAAKYSSFAKENCQKAEESAPGTVETVMSVHSKEKGFESTMCGKDGKCNRSKRRKAVQKAVNSESPRVKRSKGAGGAKDAVEDSKCKAEQSNNDNCAEKTNTKALPASTEKPNYIHVRARRGQATDSHSLAERVRREKISERMKLLQDLVPGCSKITGKALMLDEIINHVQSLQRQVEFLSMKLATVNPLFDIDIDRFCAKDIMTFSPRNPPNGLLTTELTTSPYLQYPQPEPGVPQSSSLWNAQLHNVFNSGFYPVRMERPFNSQVNNGNFTVNQMTKREM